MGTLKYILLYLGIAQTGKSTIWNIYLLQPGLPYDNQLIQARDYIIKLVKNKGKELELEPCHLNSISVRDIDSPT